MQFVVVGTGAWTATGHVSVDQVVQGIRVTTPMENVSVTPAGVDLLVEPVSFCSVAELV